MRLQKGNIVILKDGRKARVEASYYRAMKDVIMVTFLAKDYSKTNYQADMISSHLISKVA
jgi:hypothetical protein